MQKKLHMSIKSCNFAPDFGPKCAKHTKDDKHKQLKIRIMKLNKLFSACMLAAALCFVACEDGPTPTPGPGPGPGPDPKPVNVDTTGIEATVAEVIEVVNSLEQGGKRRSH